MKFVAKGEKAKPYHIKISEVDLLFDSKRSIRGRQRVITMLSVLSWRNISPINGKKYSRAIVELLGIYAN